jgi:hypothetical protein
MPKSDHEILDPMAAISARDPLVAVDRAVAEIRRGGFVVINGGSEISLIVQAAEAATPQSLDRFSKLAGSDPILVLTPHRAVALGIESPKAGPVLLQLVEGSAAQEIRDIADPGAGRNNVFRRRRAIGQAGAVAPRRGGRHGSRRGRPGCRILPNP